MATIEDARALAEQIKNKNSGIHGIELFGSVQKNGVGYDIDLMIIVDDEIAQQFWSVPDDTNPKWPPRLLILRRFIKRYFRKLDEAVIKKRKQTRLLRASKLINIDLAALGEEYRPGTVIDAWLMPKDWQLRIDSITNNSNMRVFLKLIAPSSQQLI
jgi:predicted nucleotidyltransferase